MLYDYATGALAPEDRGGTVAERFADNLSAIKLARTLAGENAGSGAGAAAGRRAPDAAEQAALLRYVGWGEYDVRRQALDSRQEEAGGLSTPTPQGLMFGGASAFPIPANAYLFTASAGVVYEFHWLPIILKPGTYLRLVAGTTNTSMDVRLSWQERIPTPSEL